VFEKKLVILKSREPPGCHAQVVTDLPRLIECISDVLCFLPRPDQRLRQNFLGVPFDVAMKFTFLKQFTRWNEPPDQRLKQLVIPDSRLFLALPLVGPFGGALPLHGTHGQIPF